MYAETVEDAANEDETGAALPDVHQGEPVKLLENKPEQHFTQPPPRFSEATLVKELEEKGIGRPSTYAAILSTVQDRGYVEKKEGRLHPTELGVMVNGLLVKSFPDIVSTDFTAQMEERLDKVEEGQQDWVKLLETFYAPFKLDLEKAKVEMRDVKREEQPTDEVCEKCTKPMVIKWGRNGHFLACSGYPDCRNTKEYTRNADGTLKVVPTTRPSDQVCPACSSPMVIKRGRFGEFLACSRYPDCKTTSPISLGVSCPKEGCTGYLTEKRSRRGKIFFGCSNYSKTACDFVSWDRPAAAALPEVRREVRRPEGHEVGNADPLPERGLRLQRRRRPARSWRSSGADRHRVNRVRTARLRYAGGMNRQLHGAALACVVFLGAAGCGGGSGGGSLPLSEFHDAVLSAECHLQVLCGRLPDEATCLRHPSGAAELLRVTSAVGRCGPNRVRRPEGQGLRQRDQRPAELQPFRGGRTRGAARLRPGGPRRARCRRG